MRKHMSHSFKSQLSHLLAGLPLFVGFQKCQTVELFEPVEHLRGEMVVLLKQF